MDSRQKRSSPEACTGALRKADECQPKAKAAQKVFAIPELVDRIVSHVSTPSPCQGILELEANS
jgi:hypothetical protein